MPLPKELATVTPLSKFAALILFISLPFIGLLVGLQYQQNIDLQNKEQEINQVRSQYEKRLKQIEEDYQLAVEDRGKLISTSKSTYKYEDFGVYSPLFENKTVYITKYTYKRQFITRREIIVEEDKNSNTSLGVIVWEYNNGTTPSVIFDGYENYYTYSVHLSDLKSKWKDSYLPNNGIKMYWDYDYEPRVIGSVYLEAFQPYSPNGNQLFIRLWAYTDDYPKTTNLSINKAKEKLKKIADTIPYRK